MIGDQIEIFLDDWTLYSLINNHLENLKQMLQLCRESDMCLNPNKCSFMVPIGNLLGHIIMKEGLPIELTKEALILGFPTPTTTKQLKGILGLTEYYRRFIRNYAHISTPLEGLLKKDFAFVWTLEHQLAFDTLKKSR